MEAHGGGTSLCRGSLRDRFAIAVGAGIAGVALCLSWPAIAQAGEDGGVEGVIEELFLGETVYPQKQFELQVASRFDWYRSGPTNTVAVPLAIEFGLTDRLQVALESAAGIEPSGIRPIGVSTKYTFLSLRDPGVALAAGIELGLPSFIPEVGEDGFRYEPFLIGYKALDPVFFNLFGALEIEQENGQTEIGGDVVLGTFQRATSWLFPTVELGLKLGGGDPVVTLAPGLLVHPGFDLELGIALPIRLTKAADIGVLFALTWEGEFGQDDAEPISGLRLPGNARAVRGASSRPPAGGPG